MQDEQDFGLTTDLTDYTEHSIDYKGYVLHSTTPNGWWGDQCGERGWFYLDGLLSQPIEQFASGGRLAAIESEGEFVEVIIQAVVANSPLMGFGRNTDNTAVNRL